VHTIIIVLIILNQSQFLWAEQPANHMRSANSKPQIPHRPNQAPPTFVIVSL